MRQLVQLHDSMPVFDALDTDDDNDGVDTIVELADSTTISQPVQAVSKERAEGVLIR